MSSGTSTIPHHLHSGSLNTKKTHPHTHPRAHTHSRKITGFFVQNTLFMLRLNVSKNIKTLSAQVASRTLTFHFSVLLHLHIIHPGCNVECEDRKRLVYWSVDWLRSSLRIRNLISRYSDPHDLNTDVKTRCSFESEKFCLHCGVWFSVSVNSSCREHGDINNNNKKKPTLATSHVCARLILLSWWDPAGSWTCLLYRQENTMCLCAFLSEDACNVGTHLLLAQALCLVQK